MNFKTLMFASLASLLIVAGSSDAISFDLLGSLGEAFSNTYSLLSRHRGNGGCKNNYDLDYMLLALQWSAGVCSTDQKQCERGQNVYNFTIHGFWPNRYGSRYGPQDCCFERKFDFELLRPILPELKTHWYSYFGKNELEADKKFWTHEWTKHGTCAKNIPQLHGEYNYFKTSLETFMNLPIAETLAQAGIVPDNNQAYKGRQIIEALRDINEGKQVELGCKYERSHDRTPDLIGVNFCFSPELKPIDCPESKPLCLKDLRYKKTMDLVRA